MSWLGRLYETYESVSNNEQLNETLEPYFHKYEQCHIEIILDDKGNFVRAESLVHEVLYGKQSYWKGEDTLIPITPKSLTGRTRGSAPYPLIEKVQYVAKDYPDFGGVKASYFEEYFDQIDSWVTSQYSHPKVEAVAKYVNKGTVVRDLAAANILFVFFNDSGKTILISNWSQQGLYDEVTNKKIPKPPLLNAVNNNEQGNATIRWRIQLPGELNDKTWNDLTLIKSWIEFQKERNPQNGFCQVLGKKSFIARTHPKGIVKNANDAKLISAPTDKSYLTFQGRFVEANQACSLSFEVSQKSHNALRWLINNRQGFRNGTQTFVAWAVSGKQVPPPLLDTWSLLGSPIEEFYPENSSEDTIDHSVDIGQSFALQLNKYLAGYKSKFDLNEQVIFMGFDSSTPGRMGVICYRELLASDFFARIEAWHKEFAWYQRYSIEDPKNKKGKKKQKKTVWPVSAPVPKSIIETAFGKALDLSETLRRSAMERIVPCIIDGRPFPRDIMKLAVKRASNRNSCEHWEWERNLGVACALFKGFHMRHPDNKMRREYAMTLEEDRTTRDYLFGRLLAIAERTEEMAMIVADEKPRSTVASRLMQRFADRPYSTWLNIEKGVVPYQARLKNNIAPLADAYKRLLDDVCDKFEVEEFTSKESLTGEFLLGFHSQRKWLREHKLKKGEWVQREQGESTKIVNDEIMEGE